MLHFNKYDLAKHWNDTPLTLLYNIPDHWNYISPNNLTDEEKEKSESDISQPKLKGEGGCHPSSVWWGGAVKGQGYGGVLSCCLILKLGVWWHVAVGFLIVLEWSWRGTFLIVFDDHWTLSNLCFQRIWHDWIQEFHSMFYRYSALLLPDIPPIDPALVPLMFHPCSLLITVRPSYIQHSILIVWFFFQVFCWFWLFCRFLPHSLLVRSFYSPLILQCRWWRVLCSRNFWHSP